MSRSGVQAYAMINSRVRAMYGRMINRVTWTRLLSCGDRDALINTLSETAYGPFLTDLLYTTLTTRRVEYEIRKHLAHDFKTIITYAPPYAQPLMKQLFRLYEVDNLKAVLRGIAINATWERVRYMLFPMDTFPTLPYQSMVEAKSIPAAVEIIRNTPYNRTLSLAMDRYLSENSLFPIEVALDLDYWQSVWQEVNNLPATDREISKSMIGLIIDRINLTWAARYRIYYHLSEEEIINYTLGFGYKIDDEFIRAIASDHELPSLVIQAYPKIVDTVSFKKTPIENLPLLEVSLQRLFMEKCKAAFIGSPFNIGVMQAYLFLLEFEVQDLIVLLEAKSLGIPSEEYEPFLVVCNQMSEEVV